MRTLCTLNTHTRAQKWRAATTNQPRQMRIVIFVFVFILYTHQNEKTATSMWKKGSVNICRHQDAAYSLAVVLRSGGVQW
mmetsp:Transcript_42213/g.108705  ORF Transcript_42213/g.108705 Transcript_42213/m.108705 type:complete len:80 (+) Transcript_42213:189-428(+)